MATGHRGGPEKPSIKRTVGIYDRPARADSSRYVMIAIAVVVALAATGIALFVL